MKLNNKGFAISSVMYIILVLGIILIILTLSLLSSRKLVLDKLKNEVLDDIYYLCKGATSETVTTGKIPTGNYFIGDEYICEVKPGVSYHFFVVSTEEDRINLILDRNINSDGSLATEIILKENVVNGVYNSVPWIDVGSNQFGPVTAMDFVYNATKYWTNVSDIEVDYIDEGNTGYGYGGIKTVDNVTTITKKDGVVTATYENLKARMPSYSEVSSISAGCLASGIPTCKLWISNYLNKSYSITGNGNKINTNIDGYWILSSNVENGWEVWFVNAWLNGDAADAAGGYVDNGTRLYSYGVRPVISVLKSDIK